LQRHAPARVSQRMPARQAPLTRGWSVLSQRLRQAIPRSPYPVIAQLRRSCDPFRGSARGIERALCLARVDDASRRR
jgi:hypothetical protein